MVSYIQSLLRFILFAVGTVIVTVVVSPPLVLSGYLTKDGTAPIKAMRIWAWCITKLMGLTYSVSGVENAKPETSYIITPNHQSNTDILALIWTLPVRFHWVLKKELLKIPFFGSALVGVGSIALNRAEKEGAMKNLEDGVKNKRPDWSILIYPEGTRTSDGSIKSFKKGAFVMAVQTGIPILPVTCNGAYKIMPKDKLLFTPGHIHVAIGKPIPTEGLTYEDIPELMEKTRSAMMSNFDADYDPFKTPN